MKSAMPLEQARRIAGELAAELLPFADRLEIVGSIRRKKATVGDVELLIIPSVLRSAGGLFGDAIDEDNLLDKQLRRMMECDTIAHRKGFKGGWKFSQWSYQGVTVDLFSSSVQTWGCLCLIRTGPAEYSHRLVTPRQQNGLCPAHLRFKDGRLYCQGQKEPLATPEEKDVFEALDLDFVPPEERE